MKFGFVGATAVVFLGAGWAAAQSPPLPTGKPIPYSPPGSSVPSSPAAYSPAAPVSTSAAMGSGSPTTPTTGSGSATSPAPTYSTPTKVTGPVYDPPGGPCVDGSCGSSYIPCGQGHGEGGRGGGAFYVDGEYLLWHIDRGPVPNFTSISPVGVLTIPTQKILINAPSVFSTTNNLLPVFLQSSPGSSPLNTGEHSGARLTAGYWADSDRSLGFETSFFFLERLNHTFSANTSNTSNPFIVNPGLSNNLTIMTPTLSFAQSFPVIFLGQATAALVGSSTTEMWGGEANVRCTSVQYGCASFGFLAGFRYLDFSESLIAGDSVALSLTPQSAFAVVTTGVASTTFNFTPPAANIKFVTADSIITHNHFYGGQIGGDFDVILCNFFFSARGKLGLGTMHEVVNIASSLTTTQVGFGGPAVTTGPGGLLTSAADVGQHGRNRICFLPEGNLRWGYCCSRWLRFWVGYDALYVSNVARPGLTAGVNTTTATVNINGVSNVVNVQQPTFKFNDTNVFAQGINFGLELTY
jgi:hypothetical protein